VDAIITAATAGSTRETPAIRGSLLVGQEAAGPRLGPGEGSPCAPPGSRRSTDRELARRGPGTRGSVGGRDRRLAAAL